MALSDIRIHRETIMVGDADFAVRGLSADIILGLLTDEPTDTKEATKLFLTEALDPESGELKLDGIGQFLRVALQRLPTLVAKAIAQAADEPEAWKTVLYMPAPKQLEALLAVGRLTFEEPDSLKNFIGNLYSLLGGLRKSLTEASGSKTLSSGQKTSGQA